MKAVFYFQLHEERTLVGSPAFKYVTVVNVDKLSELNSPSAFERVMKVEFSAEGNTIYFISEGIYNKESVTVLRMSDRQILTKKAFSSLVSLIPTKEGVVLYEENKIPELWNFELNQCIRSFTKLSGKERLFPFDDQLIACQRNGNVLSLRILFKFPQSVCTDGNECWDYSFLEDCDESAPQRWAPSNT